MKILCIGSSILETTCVINETVQEGHKYVLENKTEAGGGHAGNIAYMLSKWGIETYIASMLGADDAADKIKKDYENIGTKIDYIETAYDRQTGEALVIVNQTTKNNTVFEIAANNTLKKYTFNFEPNIIVMDGKDLNASLAAIDKYPKAQTFLVVSKNNNDSNELGKIAKNIIFSRSIAEEIANMKIDYNDSNTLVNVYNKLKQKYQHAEIIVTLGERGSIYSINGQIKIMPTVVVDLVDTYGAGDTFAGAYIYGMAREFGLEKSLAYATIAASLSTTKLTARQSIPSLTEVSSYYDSKFGVQNNPNNTAPKTDATPTQTAVEQTTLQTNEAAPLGGNETPNPGNVNNNGNV